MDGDLLVRFWGKEGIVISFTETPFAPGEEGVWLGLPAEVYHLAPGVSQSTLKEFGDYATPLHYQAREPKKPTDDMEFGTVCHTAVLEPEKLSEAYYVRPETYPDEKTGKEKPWHGASNWCKAWLEAHKDRPVLTKERSEAVPKVVERVTRIPEIKDALQCGQREVSYFKRDAETGLLLKCRVDIQCLSSGSLGPELWIFDLKKVQSGEADAEAFGASVAARGYDIQAASYMDITGASHFVFCPFDDDKPFDACLVELENEDRVSGFRTWRRLLKAYATCVTENRWPGYAEGITVAKLPPWFKKERGSRSYAAWASAIGGI